MTEKLFYLDSHLQRFSAQVEQCVPDGENWQIVLDRTAFFPEGGGQYADTGILGSARVLDVQEKDGVIFHRTDALPSQRQDTPLPSPPELPAFPLHLYHQNTISAGNLCRPDPSGGKFDK